MHANGVLFQFEQGKGRNVSALEAIGRQTWPRGKPRRLLSQSISAP